MWALELVPGLAPGSTFTSGDTTHTPVAKYGRNTTGVYTPDVPEEVPWRVGVHPGKQPLPLSDRSRVTLDTRGGPKRRIDSGQDVPP